ncbi:MAG: hypothetical protein ACJAZO_004933 [Myxococcota bacterium]|jgi:hypothetical protein
MATICNGQATIWQLDMSNTTTRQGAYSVNVNVSQRWLILQHRSPNRWHWGMAEECARPHVGNVAY